MTMAASMKRHMEHRDLLGMLTAEVDKEAKKQGGLTLLFELARVLSECLEQSVSHLVRPDFAEKTFFLRDSILLRIKEFSRSQAEYDFLVAGLFGEVVRLVDLYFLTAFQREVLSCPTLFSDAPSAMAEVPTEGSV